MTTFTFGATTTPAGAGDGGGDSGILITNGLNASPGGSVLSAPGTILSLSIYVKSGALGNVLLGLYDNTGPSGQAGNLVASCPSTALVNGWNTINVSTPVLIPAGTYWFAFTPSSNTPIFGTETVTGYVLFKGAQPFTMPSVAPTFSSSTTQQFGMYATLTSVPSTTIPLDFFGTTVLGPVETNLGGSGKPLIWPSWNPTAYRAIDNFGGIAADGFTYSEGVTQWGIVETADGTYLWDLFDAVWAKLIANNVNSVVFSFENIPQWASVGNAYSFSCTITSATPGVVTAAGNNFANGWKVFFTAGTVPTGLALNTIYFVVSNGVDGAGKFRLSLTSGGAAINTTGSAGTSTVTAKDSPPANMAKLTAWVTSYLTRAVLDGLPVKYVEGVNEPSDGVGFYVGTIAELVTIQQTIYNAAKAFDSTIQVLAPPVNGFTTGGTNAPGTQNGGNSYLSAFLVAGGGAYCDIIAFHGYPPDPGTLSPVTYATDLAAFTAMLATNGQGAKLLWNTEYSSIAGVPATNETYLAVTTFIDLSNGISRKYFYSYDASADILWSPPNITPPNGALNVAGVAFQQLVNWLVGITLSVPVNTVGVVSSCDFAGASGYIARAVWTTDASTPAYTTPVWTTQYRDLAGTLHGSPGATITIGANPLFLEGTLILQSQACL